MGEWWGRWRVALRIAWREARRNKGRTALVVAMIALPLMAGTALISGARSAETNPTDRVGPTAQAVVTADDCSPVTQTPDGTGFACDATGEPVPLDAQALGTILGDAPLAELRRAPVDLLTDHAVLTGESITQIDAAAALPAIADLVTGRFPTEPGEVVLVASQAERLGLDLDDELRLARGDTEQSATMVGTVTGIGPAWALTLPGTVPEDWLLADATWVVLGDHDVTWDDVLAANENGWSVLSRAVLLDPPPVEEVPYGAVSATESPARDIGLIGAVLAMGLLEVALLIGPAFAVGARRDARKLALMAAAGAQPRDLRRTVLGSGVIAGLLAAVVGIGGGLALASIGMWWLRRTGNIAARFTVPSWEILALLAVALLIGIAAAWFPARTASRADVVAALAGRRVQPPSSRGVPRLGVAVLTLGVVVLAAAAVFAEPVGLVAGVVILEIGVVLVSGGAVALAARLAPRMGLAARFALRDGARHRSRSAPAVAAITVAVAAAAAGSVYAAGESAAQQDMWVRMTAAPAALIQVTPDGGSLTPDVIASRERTAQVGVDLAVDAIPDASGALVIAAASADAGTADWDALFPSVSTDPNPDQVCPFDDPRDGADDPRCVDRPRISAGASWHARVLIDDGSMLAITELPGWQEAAATLREGGVVVASLEDVWPDGTAHLINDSDGGTPGEVDLQAAAYVSGWDPRGLPMIISPEVADQLGLIAVPTGGLVTSPQWPEQATVDQLNAQLRNEGQGSLWLGLDRARDAGLPVAWVLTGVAALVALVAVGLAVGLARADARPDMATMAAVGASPRIRRRIAAAQAGLLTVIGSVLGVLTGAVIGLVLGWWTREQVGYEELWPLTVPWQVPLMALLVPAAAMALTWLFTRSRLPLVRRVAE